MPSIFLSHNQNDKPFVRRLAKDLTSEGVKVWLDEAEIKVGDSLIRKIQSGIYEMDYLGAILSPDSVKSAWVQEELEQALHIQISEAYVKVLPILLRNCDMPGFLLGKVYADFREEEKYQDSFAKLLKSIQSKYINLQQSIPKNEPFQERIGDILVKEGFDGLLQLVKQGKYKDELRKFIANQAVQPNLRIMALKVMLDSEQQDDQLFKKLLKDFDQDVRKRMIMGYREKGFEIDEETLRDVISNAPSSSGLLENAVKLARDLVKNKKISSNILLEKNIINDPYWVISISGISGIIGADEPNSAELLSYYSGETYHVARKRIREYFEYLHDNDKFNDANREKAIELLQKFCKDGKSSETAQKKMQVAIEKLSEKKR